MSKWLRRDKAKECPIHMMVMEEAARQLSLHGVFEKEAVLDDMNLSAMSDAIRWDYIREFLEEEQGCEMVPLASAYFKRHKKNEEHVNPIKFIAQGYGKKTVGFAAVLPENDHLVVAKIDCKKRMANGVGEAFQKYLVAVETKRALSIATTSQDQIEA